jgi:hypothetical protein
MKGHHEQPMATFRPSTLSTVSSSKREGLTLEALAGAMCWSRLSGVILTVIAACIAIWWAAITLITLPLSS